MLDLRCDNVLSYMFLLPRHILDHPVVRLTATGCKKDFLRLRINHPRNLCSRILKDVMHPHTHLIRSGRIAVLLPEVRLHRLAHLGQHLRRSRMIHINSTTHILCPLFIQ